MADYADNYTTRYRITYTALGKQHVTTFRCGRQPVDAGLITQLNALFTALEPVRTSDWTFISADEAQFDSDLFFPASLLPSIGAGDLTPPAQSFQPVFISFQGRSNGGSRASAYIYGVSLDPLSSEGTTQDYRISTQEAPWVDAAVQALNGTGPITAIDGNKTVWKPYVNVGVNAYYQRKRRG